MPDPEPPSNPVRSLAQAFVHGPFVRPPRTRVGWTAVALAVGFVALSGVDRLLATLVAEHVPWRSTLRTVAAAALLATGGATGIAAAIAVWRLGERSWALAGPLVVGLGVAIYLLGRVGEGS